MPVDARFVPLQGVIGIIVTGRQLFRWRSLQPGRRMRRPYTDLSNLPGLGCRVDARCVSLQGVVSIIVTGRTIVPLEVFTNRARRASPLHRCAPYKVGTACRWRFMGAVSFVCVTMIGDNLRHLWFGIPPVSNVRSQPSASIVVHLEVFNEPGEACLAPTQMCSRQDRDSVPVAFHGRGFIRLRDDQLRKSASSAVRHSPRVQRSRSTIGVDGGSPGGLYNRARHASPLHRCAPYKAGTVCR